MLKRTFDTWGSEAQGRIARMSIGIVGLGSVGCVVAEALARVGVGDLTLVDHDAVEEHNLDRLLFATAGDIGRSKVELAKELVEAHATAEKPKGPSDRSAGPRRFGVQGDAGLRCDIQLC